MYAGASAERWRFPEQKLRLEKILALPDVRTMKIDMTGIGWGLFEFTEEKYRDKLQGVNFSSSVPVPQRMAAEGNGNLNVRVTEAMATQLLYVFEDRAIQIPIDDLLRDDLRKPERMVSASGRVSIAATRDEAGHADHFWSLALAIHAAQVPPPKKFEWHSWLPKCRERRVTL